MAKPRNLLRTVGSISSATMVSRVLGLVRDQVQSYYFGAGAVTDAFVAAFRVPNLLRDLFAEGALSSAFVPTFTAEREKNGAEAAWRLARRLMTALALLLGAVGLGIAVGAPFILGLYVPGFDGEKMQLAIHMTRILAPFLLCVGLAAVAMGVLNTCGRFFVPALAPASFNVAVILSVILLYGVLDRAGYPPGLALAIGAMFGGAMQLIVQLPALRRVGFRFKPELALRDPGLRRIAMLMLPATLGLAATQINILVDTILASRFGDGPITWLMLAFRLIQLPIGVFGVAIGVANLARVSLDAARDDTGALRESVAAALRASALLALPATAGLVALRVPIVRVLLEHGEFDAVASGHTADAVLCYSLGLFAYSVTKVQAPTFYALGNTRTPAIASVVAVALKIAANFVLIALLPRFGIDPFLGLALSTSLAAWVNFGWLAVAMRRQAGSLRGRNVVSTTLAMVLLSGVMGLAVAAVHAGLERALAGGGLLGEIVRLALAIGAGFLVWGVGVWRMRIPEVQALLRRIGIGT